MEQQSNPFLPPAFENLGLQRFVGMHQGPSIDAPTNRDHYDAINEGANRGPQPTSALQGLTVQQILDLDIENFAVCIERHHTQAKKAILDHFLDVKAKMLAHQNAALEEESKAAGLKLAAKQAEIDLLRFELHQATSRMSKLGDISRNMAAAYDAAKHQKRCGGLLIQAFYGWRQRSLEHRQRAGRLARGLEWYKTEHLQRHVLRSWFKVSCQQRKVRLREEAAADQVRLRQECEATAAAQVEAMRQQLLEAQAALSREQEAREKLEENMKQAFMRGVCALNIEAMSIFKRGAPPGGVNPYPDRPLSQATSGNNSTAPPYSTHSVAAATTTTAVGRPGLQSEQIQGRHPNQAPYQQQQDVSTGSAQQGSQSPSASGPVMHIASVLADSAARQSPPAPYVPTSTTQQQQRQSAYPHNTSLVPQQQQQQSSDQRQYNLNQQYSVQSQGAYPAAGARPMPTSSTTNMAAQFSSSQLPSAAAAAAAATQQSAPFKSYAGGSSTREGATAASQPLPGLTTSQHVSGAGMGMSNAMPKVTVERSVAPQFAGSSQSQYPAQYQQYSSPGTAVHQQDAVPHPRPYNVVPGPTARGVGGGSGVTATSAYQGPR